MNLQHIKYTSCPDCSARLSEQTKRNQHCNGHWNEYVHFDCGNSYRFTPNFMKVEQVTKCTISKEYKELAIKRRSALNALLEHINNIDIDDEFKTHYHKLVKESYFR